MWEGKRATVGRSNQTVQMQETCVGAGGGVGRGWGFTQRRGELGTQPWYQVTVWGRTGPEGWSLLAAPPPLCSWGAPVWVPTSCCFQGPAGGLSARETCRGPSGSQV